MLRKVYFGLLYLLPAVLFFSYYPLLSLGSDSTMNFEFSLPLIWLLIFAPVAFLNLLFVSKDQKSQKTPKSSGKQQPTKSSSTTARARFFKPQLPGPSDRRFFLFALFPLYATLSIFWSANPTRALLTAGVLWLTFFTVFAILWITPLLHPSSNFRTLLLKSLLFSTIFICLFCWVQCILDVFNLPRSATLLCPGCTYTTFGFPHPSGFAIEPQFMGNLLLAPTLLCLFLLVYPGLNSQFKLPTPFLIFSTLLFSATLFVTMSRGAIYAYGIALIILGIFALVQRQKWQLVLVIPVVTFSLSLVAQGIFSALSPTSDTFYSGTAKVIHQLSLGLIDLRPAQHVENPVENSQSAPKNGSAASTDSQDLQDTQDNESMFDGYVAASTNVRLGLNDLAIATWQQTLPHILFGVGLGGAGIAISHAFPEHELALPNAIIQNEPLSLLLESGLIGILLILLALFLAFSPRSAFWHHPALPLLCALIVAYFITLNFFSGLPNALQIYLLPPLLYFLFLPQKR